MTLIVRKLTNGKSADLNSYHSFLLFKYKNDSYYLNIRMNLII